MRVNAEWAKKLDKSQVHGHWEFVLTIELLGGAIGSKTSVHPNDHVNRGQSSNDVIPSAIHISALEGIEKNLLTSLDGLHEALTAKAR